jgi:hypothetical protein
MFSVELFPGHQETERSTPAANGSSQPPWFKIDFRGFGGAILLSAAFHLVLVFLFSLTTLIQLPSLPPPPLTDRATENDLALFSAALEELTREKGYEEKLARAVSTLKEDKLPELPKQFRLLQKNMSDREKIEIFKKLLEGYFASLDSGQVSSSRDLSASGSIFSSEKNFQIKTGDRVFLQPAASQEGQVELYVLEADTSQEVEAFQKADRLRYTPRIIGPGQIIKLNVSGHYAEVPAEYYYRRCPFEEILARGAYLFSIVRGFPKIGLEKTSLEKLKRPQPPQLFPQGEFQVIYYGEAEIPRPQPETFLKDNRPALDLRPEEWNQKFDSLMNEPEEIQFARFEKDYLQPYSWNDPALAEFTRNFINSNLNGVFLIEDEFTKAFDSLEEFFYKKPIFERMAALIASNPPSPVRDELMFCLASSLDLERRVINNLEKAYTQAKEVCLKKYPLSHVHYSLSKAYVLKKMYEELTAELKRLQFSSLEEVEKKYLEKELAIYRMLTERSGKTRARALYALGLTYWEEGQADLAIKTWQQGEGKDCPEHLASLLKIIRERPLATVYTYIDNELNYQAARNTKYLYRRQLQFHKWARRKN